MFRHSSNKIVERGSFGGSTIEASALTKQYGQRTVVDGLTFEIAAGEIFGVLGRNGSGKSTTVRMLTTLTRPTSGSASVAGHDVVSAAAAVRRVSGVTLQDAALDPNMTAPEHLRLIGRLLGSGRAETQARTDELLGSFGLSEHGRQAIGTYSGGMQRRLDIATALFSSPPVLFLDEPTTGLDPQSRRVLWEHIRRLRAAGTTVLLTTQYLEEADQLADRLVVLDGGRIVAEGSPAALRAMYGRRTITIPSSGGGSLAHLAGAGIAVLTVGDRTIIELEPGISLDEVLTQVRIAVGSLESATIAQASLEDVFVHLTGSDINTGATPTGELVA